MRVFILAYLISLFSLPATAQLRKYIDDGKIYLSHKNYLAALDQFTQYTKLFPNDAEGYYWIGYSYVLSKQYPDAEAYLNKAMLLAPKFVPTYVAYGQMFFDRELYENSIPYLLRATELNDQNPLVYNTLGMSCYYVGKYELAIKYFNRAIKLDSTYAAAYSNRGAARYNAQNIAVANKIDKELAEQDLNISLKLDSTSEVAYRNRAFIRLFQNKLPGAYMDITIALKKDPKDSRAQYCYALILLADKQYKNALVEFDKAIKLKNNQYDFYLDRGLCKIHLYDGEGARKDFRQAMALNPNCKPMGYYHTARSYAADKDKELMLDYIIAASKAGLFKFNYYFKEMQADEYFKYYAKDKDYTDLMFKIKFGKI